MYDHYFEITVNAEKTNPYLRKGSLVGIAWRQVHQAAARASIPFAVSLPDFQLAFRSVGQRLRIFTEGAAGAEKILAGIRDLPGAETHLTFGAVTAVDLQKSHAYEAYFMQRLPHSPSKKRKTIPWEEAVEFQKRAAERRMAEQRHLPFVWMESSTGRTFKLVIERKVALYGEPPELGQPNGYGLSRKSQVVSLPIIP